jgi:hypothetical protein
MRGFAPQLLLAILLAAGPLALTAKAQPVQIAAPAATETPFRQTFEQDARTRLRVWGAEIADFTNAAEANGQGQDDAAGVELQAAWAETKTQERNLELASRGDWEVARTTFSQASRRLEDALDKAHARLD